MMLYINGQDIERLVLGLHQPGKDDVLHSVAARPETFLAELDRFLTERGVRREDLRGIVVVVGPGSATALRASLSIVSSLHLARSLPLYAVEKSKDMTDSAAFLHGRGTEAFPPGMFPMPVYEHDPRITLSTRDALLRAM